MNSCKRMAPWSRLPVVLCLLIACPTVASAQRPNPRALAAVKAGKLAEAKASWWGFDKQDATRALQSALNSGASRIVVDNVGSPWIVTPINVPSNVEVVFEKGVVVEAKKGEFRRSNDCLLRLDARTNVTLIGYEATLRMHRADYDREPYKKAEWRHAISLGNCTNVKIYGLTIEDSGGDGIYLGAASRGVTNKNIHIKDVVCDRNYRQGISVITAENLLIENTTLRNTAGTNPQAGIDFEPNRASERLVNCVMRNCVAENNAGGGFFFYLPYLTGASTPISIRLEKCVAKGTNRVPFALTLTRPNADGPAKGTIELVDCTFADAVAPGITIRNKPASACRVRFQRCRISERSSKQVGIPAILLIAGEDVGSDFGGIALEQCVVERVGKRPLVRFEDRTGESSLVDVTGTLIVKEAGGQHVVQLTPEWLQTARVGKRYKRFSVYDMNKHSFVPLRDQWKPELTEVPPFALRGSATFVLYARRGEHVSFALRSLQVGKYNGETIKPIIVTPTGTKVSVGSVPFKQEKLLAFDAAATGVYRIVAQAGANKVQITQCTHPLCVTSDDGRIHFISTVGDFYFYVPKNTTAFGVKVHGEGGEAIGAAVFDPSGAKVWEKPTVSMPEQFVGKPNETKAGQVWRLRLSRPAAGAMEDFFVRLQGIPLLLARDPKMLLRPVGK